MHDVGPHRVLFATSEVYPYSKSGGLADVAHSLPRALRGDYDLAVVSPLYRGIDTHAMQIRFTGNAFAVSLGGDDFPVEIYRGEHEGVTHYFVYAAPLSERDELYGSPESGYEDNDLRFGIFCHALVRLQRETGAALVHLNDWQTALAALLLENVPGVRTLYTIHNLAYQGIFEAASRTLLGIADEAFTMEGVEFYGRLNLMKAGIGNADAVTTVSSVYADEICTPRFGCGLEGYLRRHRGKLSGILNGIDTRHFATRGNPFLDPAYDAADFAPKARHKSALCAQMGFADAGRPLLVLINRFTWQKGIDLLIDTLGTILKQPLNLVLLGEGEQAYFSRLETFEQDYENIRLLRGYDEALSHRLYAASDFLLMPSRYEPCGLNQMIAMHYGSVPVVHGVGGLKESVSAWQGFDPASASGYGIVYDEEQAIDRAVDEALELYERQERYEAICRHNMGVDFSWAGSASKYAALYDTLMEAGA